MTSKPPPPGAKGHLTPEPETDGPTVIIDPGLNEEQKKKKEDAQN